MNKQNRYSPEVRERAVQMLLEQQREYHSQWAAIDFRCWQSWLHSGNLAKWVRQAEIDQGK